MHCSARLQASSQCPPMAKAPSNSRNQRGKDRASSQAAQPLPVTQPNPPRPLTWGRERGRGRGQEPPATLPTATAPATTTSRPPNIIWDENQVRKLVTWIVDHPADRRILYGDRNQSGSAPPLSNECPSGKQKKDIHAAIAKHIFEGEDPEYSNNPSRYAKSVSNQLIAYIHTHTTLAYPDF